ncbi:sugar transporter, partial [Aspergillus sclerotialis]
MWTASGGLRGRSLRVAITFTAVMGFSLFGYNQGMMAGLIDGEEFTNSFDILKIPPDASPGTKHYVNVIRGAVTACYEIG